MCSKARFNQFNILNVSYTLSGRLSQHCTSWFGLAGHVSILQLDQDAAIMMLCADAGQQSSQWVYHVPYQQPGVSAYHQPTVLQGQSDCEPASDSVSLFSFFFRLCTSQDRPTKWQTTCHICKSVPSLQSSVSMETAGSLDPTPSLTSLCLITSLMKMLIAPVDCASSPASQVYCWWGWDLDVQCLNRSTSWVNS